MTIFSRISRWFSIREKLLIAFVGLSAAPLGSVAESYSKEVYSWLKY